MLLFVLKMSKDSIAYPKEFHSKIMARRSSKDSGDGKSPKVTNSPYREQVCSLMYVKGLYCKQEFMSR